MAEDDAVGAEVRVTTRVADGATVGDPVAPGIEVDAGEGPLVGTVDGPAAELRSIGIGATGARVASGIGTAVSSTVTTAVANGSTVDRSGSAGGGGTCAGAAGALGGEASARGGVATARVADSTGEDGSGLAVVRGLGVDCCVSVGSRDGSGAATAGSAVPVGAVVGVGDGST